MVGGGGGAGGAGWGSWELITDRWWGNVMKAADGGGCGHCGHDALCLGSGILRSVHVNTVQE